MKPKKIIMKSLWVIVIPLFIYLTITLDELNDKEQTFFIMIFFFSFIIIGSIDKHTNKNI